MRHVVAAVDFSAPSDAAVERAVELAEAFGARMTLLHVAAPDPDFVGYEVGPQGERDARARELRGEHATLQERAAALRARGLDARALLVEGPSVETLLAEAERLEADLLVMGSHGHGRLYDALVGSVSAGVIRAGRLPVLLVPRPRGSAPEEGTGSLPAS